MIEQPLYEKVTQAFRNRYLRAPELIVRAPGRVNLIGEHTDYNDGFVLPLAVDRAAWVAIARNNRWDATLRALDMGNTEATFTVDRVPASIGSWADYPMSIVWAFLEKGLRPAGIEAVMASDVPVGAGMSSSAAVELSFAYTWNLLGDFGLSRPELALLAQRAENEYVGMKCGIMDQMISACGKAGYAMLLDTRSLEQHHFALPEGIAVVVADSMVRRQLASSEYNVRRAQCEEAVRLLREQLPEIRALRDVTPEMLDSLSGLLSEVVFRRARHVVKENARVLAMTQALQQGDLARAGTLMKESHVSLCDDYEVSAPELDALVAAAWDVPGCYGARLTGAGFGGCIVALADERAAADIAAHLDQTYIARFGKHPTVYVVHPADGVAEIGGDI